MLTKGACKFVEKKVDALLDPEMSNLAEGPLLLVSLCQGQYLRQKTGFSFTRLLSLGSCDTAVGPHTNKGTCLHRLG